MVTGTAATVVAPFSVMPFSLRFRCTFPLRLFACFDDMSCFFGATFVIVSFRFCLRFGLDFFVFAAVAPPVAHLNVAVAVVLVDFSVVVHVVLTEHVLLLFGTHATAAAAADDDDDDNDEFTAVPIDDDAYDTSALITAVPACVPMPLIGDDVLSPFVRCAVVAAVATAAAAAATDIVDCCVCDDVIGVCVC